MTVIIFLVDNTPSMLQQSILNEVRLSYINLAKRVVDSFLKLRESYEDRKRDRYMLLTYDTPPNHVKVGWKESREQFDAALRNLECTGSVPGKVALDNAFELLNQERMTVRMDTYGCGRCPSYSLYGFIILITNYRHEPMTIAEPRVLPPSSILTGSLLTKEPFRWDQRLFALILGSTSCTPFISQMCRRTGGWCMAANSKEYFHRAISKLLDSIKLELMVNFVHESKTRTEIGEFAAIELRATKCAIACGSKSSKSSWPFPESYWPSEHQTKLALRVAHPEVRILSTCCDEPVWKVSVPIDKYKLRVCELPDTTLPVTDCGKVWPVEIVSSVAHHKERPFGYLKKESENIFLYVLPYDYPELHRLLSENYAWLSTTNKHFIYCMKNYINSIPMYYCFYLRKALTGILQESVLQTLLPPEKIYFLNATILNQLHQLQETAKQSRKNLCCYVAKQQTHPAAVAKQPETVERLNLQRLLKEEKDFQHFFLGPVVLPTTERPTPNYRNLHTIDRSDLLHTLNLLRNTFYYPASSTTVPQTSVPMLRTSIDSDELVAEIVQYQRKHPDKRRPTTRKPSSAQQKVLKLKKFSLSDI